MLVQYVHGKRLCRFLFTRNQNNTIAWTPVAKYDCILATGSVFTAHWCCHHHYSCCWQTACLVTSYTTAVLEKDYEKEK